MLKCKKCKQKVKEYLYETGEELACKCQSTFDSKFKKKLWEYYEEDFLGEKNETN